MSGYAAPKLDVVRIGIIGVGARGIGAVERLSLIEGVEIKAICDKRQVAVEASKKRLEGTDQNPELYSGSEDIWEKVCEREDIDLIYTATPWHLHTPIAVYAMEHVGGDEVYNLGRSELAKKSGMKPVELQLYWLNKVTAFINQQGRKPMCWDDMPPPKSPVTYTRLLS